MSKNATSEPEQVVIKKYANRRLYNTDTSSYVTLDDLAEMVKVERDFVVYDAKSGDDLTHAVLTQIIVEQESRGGTQSLLPIPFLRQLIRLYGDNMERFVPSYLEFSLDSLTREQERFREQFTNSFGNATFEAIQEQTRTNLAVFEKAMGMFSPFPQQTEGDPAPTETTPNGDTTMEKPVDTQPEAQPPRSADEISALKAELSEMQQKLERLSRG